jgi:hypothetical protein
MWRHQSCPSALRWNPNPKSCSRMNPSSPVEVYKQLYDSTFREVGCDLGRPTNLIGKPWVQSHIFSSQKNEVFSHCFIPTKLLSYYLNPTEKSYIFNLINFHKNFAMKNPVKASSMDPKTMSWERSIIWRQVNLHKIVEFTKCYRGGSHMSAFSQGRGTVGCSRTLGKRTSTWTSPYINNSLFIS